MASSYPGKGGKRGPGSSVSRGRKGNVGLGTNGPNTFAVRQARRYKAMRGAGVVRDHGQGGGLGYNVHVPGHGGKRGNSSNRVSY